MFVIMVQMPHLQAPPRQMDIVSWRQVLFQHLEKAGQVNDCLDHSFMLGVENKGHILQIQ